MIITFRRRRENLVEKCCRQYRKEHLRSANNLSFFISPLLFPFSRLFTHALPEISDSHYFRSITLLVKKIVPRKQTCIANGNRSPAPWEPSMWPNIGLITSSEARVVCFCNISGKSRFKAGVCLRSSGGEEPRWRRRRRVKVSIEANNHVPGCVGRCREDTRGFDRLSDHVRRIGHVRARVID